MEKPKRKRIARRGAEPLARVVSLADKINVTERPPIEAGKLADKLKTRAYLVGGYVRDYYLRRKRTDFDFTIIGDAVDFAKKFAKKFGSKAVIYKEFRTAMVPFDGSKLEFVGTRKERYEENSRKPIVEEGTLEDDLKRRDFACNAIAVSINKDSFGEVVDLFNGREDIEKRILRTPLDPYETFKDDPLRIIRAARFAAQLNFAVAPAAKEAAKATVDRLKIVSRERITDELFKIIASPKPSVGFLFLIEIDALRVVFPSLAKLGGVETVEENGRKYAHKDVLLHSLKVLDKIAEKSDNVWLRFAALIHDIGKFQTKRFVPGIGWTFHGHEEIGARTVPNIFRTLKLPMDKVSYVEKLIRLHQRPMALASEEVSDSAIRRLAAQAGDALEDLLALCRADITTKDEDKAKRYLKNYDIVAKKIIEVQEKDKLREFQSPVRGDEIMEICGLKPSKPVGIIKKLIEEAILDGEIPNEYEAAKRYFLERKDEWLEKIKSGELS